MTGFQFLQLLLTGPDFRLKGPDIWIVRVILVQITNLRKGEPELFELDYGEQFLQLVCAVVAVAGPHIHYVGLQQPYFS